MAAQQCWHLSFMFSWIFVLLFLSACTGMETPNLSLDNRVFVALKGEDFYIHYKVTRLANQSGECMYLTCANLHQEERIPTTNQSDTYEGRMKLKNLSSGEYSCKYQNTEVFWFLQVQNETFKKPRAPADTQHITLAVLTGVLLVFSVVGSGYVFRGHSASSRKSSLDTPVVSNDKPKSNLPFVAVINEKVQESITECGKSNRKRKQNREERKENEKEEDNVDVITAPSSSCYASLEPRPRSIYDVLNCSAANTEPDQSKAEPKDETAQTTELQSEDVFESVYENF